MGTRRCAVWIATAILAVAGTNALGQNLLLNPSFEVPDGSGNAQIWVGDYHTYSLDALCTPGSGTGARIWVPNPCRIDGLGGWEISSGAPGTIDTNMYQTVPVTGPQNVTFTGSIHAQHIDATVKATATVQLWDGPTDTGTLIGSAVVDPDTPRTNGDWVDVTISGQTTSGRVSVQLLVTLIADYGKPVAVHADNFSLTATTACGTAPALVLNPINPPTGPHNADATGVLITGTNLNLATAVKLIQVAGPTTLNAQITNTTAAQLTVTIPTSGAPLGKYNLLVEKPNCASAAAVDGFEIVCANPATMTGINPTQLQLPQTSPVQFTINGTNLTALNDVQLVGPQVFNGSINGPSGGNLLVTFSLSGAKAGGYNLVAKRPDACPAPAVLVGAVTLIAGPGENLLINGDFEAEGPKSANAPNVLGWTNSQGGPGPVYNGLSWNPNGQDVAPFGAQTTPNRGSVSEGGAAPLAQVSQVVNVSAGKEVTLLGYLAGGSWQGYQRDHRIRILDGGNGGTEIAAFNVHIDATQPTGFDWTSFNIKGVPAQTKVAVEWGWGNTTGSGWSEGTATHVDELKLTQVSVSCNNPWADFDGDGDVDQDDFGSFQLCYSGTGNPIPSSPDRCACFDVEGPSGNGDSDIDQADFQRFEACASGPMIPADPVCGN